MCTEVYKHTVMTFNSHSSAVSDLGLYCLVNYIAFIHLSLSDINEDPVLFCSICLCPIKRTLGLYG